MKNKIREEALIKPKVISEENRTRVMKSSVIEFFLGKNVIAKIAIFLIFLGIVSFGQLAYVDWLNDLGRVIMIFVIGIMFGVIAFYFERKNMDVFNNVFYSISVFTLFTAMSLATNTYNLFEDYVLTFYCIGLVIITHIYFYKKRFPFLDSVLLIFYTIVLFIPLRYLHENLTTIAVYEIVYVLILIGYIYFKYLISYYRSNLIFKFGIVLSILLIALLLQFRMKSSFYSNPEFLRLVYSIFGTYILYIVSLWNYRKIFDPFKVVIFTITTVLIGALSINFLRIFHDSFIMKSDSIVLLIFIVLFVPLYVYNFLGKRSSDKITANIILTIISFALLIYTFVAGERYIYSPYDFSYLNIINIVIALIIYIAYKITGDKMQRISSYLFIGLLLIKNLVYIMFKANFIMESLDVYLPSLIFGLTLLVINVMFKYLVDRNKELDNIIAHSTIILLSIPVIITLTSMWITIDPSLIAVAIVLMFVGYRWLLELSIFELDNKNYFITALNIKILIVIFGINIIYFDHNFSLVKDILKFWIVFLINGYVVKSLYEIYKLIDNEYDEELVAIILYCVGVLIQSFFIHRYINVDFDKVILSSYFMIASAVGILIGFSKHWTLSRKLGLGTIYYSLAKFFIYDFYTQDFTTLVRMISYFILGFVLLGISFLYSHLEKKYG